MKTNPYPVMGPGPIPPMFGRKSELEQAVQQLTKCSSQHLSVVGPRLSGKTFFLKALENYIKTKIPIY
ncbi:MAG TPA: hypothetical protein VK469_04405, partial [Candidatus Kapabacteria bacterium]|nr:hypothetical protein [Candidatus Kapabacteria bacterium]